VVKKSSSVPSGSASLREILFLFREAKLHALHGDIEFGEAAIIPSLRSLRLCGYISFLFFPGLPYP